MTTIRMTAVVGGHDFRQVGLQGRIVGGDQVRRKLVRVDQRTQGRRVGKQRVQVPQPVEDRLDRRRHAPRDGFITRSVMATVGIAPGGQGQREGRDLRAAGIVVITLRVMVSSRGA